MALTPIRFAYFTGIRRDVLRNARLAGSWDAAGRYSDDWSVQAMTAYVADDGCPAFRATALIDDAQDLSRIRWGIIVDGPGMPNLWGIPTEVADHASTERHRTLDLTALGDEQCYHLTHCRRLGANGQVLADGSMAIRFSVWAPNARSVEVVFGDPESGYIGESGEGVVETFPMARGRDGVWRTDHERSPALRVFSDYDHRPYMFKIANEQGRTVYRTDLYSRCQIGRGHIDPAHLEDGETFSGRRQDLDGTVSCSVVIDPDQVTELFSEDVWPETRWLSEADFWRDEIDPLRPVPTRIEDLVIYELHVGGLGFGRTTDSGEPEPGTLADAIAHLDHLVDLGVNCVELLPMAEFEGWASWGYGTSHYFAVEYSGGGRDQFKHFVRECHRRGIAVILDVVYNHYHHHAERAQWAYDSDAPERNIYYWYEGRPDDYPRAEPPGTGGYIDNLSTGYAPRFWDEMVRKMFISSAVALVTEFHIDGFRVDQTTSIHSYAVIHANGTRADRANIFGAKFLREWTRTLRLIKPDVILIAEDHSDWDAVTEPTDEGGLGFDAVWYADFYHHLIGDGERGPEYSRLITMAGVGDDRPLAMNYFAGALRASSRQKVVYHESHDEAGNARFSGRTMTVAVNRAPLLGRTRPFAEARARVAVALAMLSAGTPMFFMGEEIGATEDYRYDDFVYHRDDFRGARSSAGAFLFRYYQDLIRLRRSHPALRSRELQLVHVHDDNRILAFLRTDGNEDVLVLATLTNHPWSSGYQLQHPAIVSGRWREIFNSDATIYGGDNVGNLGAAVLSHHHDFSAVLPSNGVVAFRRVLSSEH